MVSDGVEAMGSTVRSDPIVQHGHERPCTASMAVVIDSTSQPLRFLGRLILMQRRLVGADFECFLLAKERPCHGIPIPRGTKKPGRTKYRYCRLIKRRKNALPSEFLSAETSDRCEMFVCLQFIRYYVALAGLTSVR